MNDGLPRRAQPALDNVYMAPPSTHMSPDTTSDPTQRSARPLSWHPSSQLAQSQSQSQMSQQPQQQYEQPALMHYPFPAYTEADLFASLRNNLPPTPAAYSGYTSPASAFSPLSLPFSEFEQQQQQAYFSPAGWAVSAQPHLSSAQPLLRHAQEQELEPNFSSTGCQPGQSSNTPEWDSFAAHGFNRCTAPPTPQDYAQAPQSEPRLQSEDSIPYEPLEDDDESNGEILYGLGLYDAPEKQVADPHVDYHRSVVSSLLGGTYTYPEPTGKGLKLEAAWEPPASDDEGSQDGSDDAEGEDQDEE